MLPNLKRVVSESINYRFELRRGTNRLAIPVVAGVGRTNRQKHEEHLVVVLRSLHALNPGALLVDVGVNIGQTLIKYALIAGPQCRYIGFEPNPRAASYADEIIRCNGMKNAVLVPVALGSGTALASLLLGAAHSTDSRASIKVEFRDADYYGTKQLVPVFHADGVLQTLGVRDRNFILKIDVEGSELDVVRGMEETLQDLQPFVIMEILPPRGKFSDDVRRFRVEQAAALKAAMANHGYEVRRIGVDGTLLLDEPGVESASDDYLFVPRDRLRELTATAAKVTGSASV